MTLPPAGSRDGLLRRLLIVGSGLLGTSIGLAMRREGVEVALSDVSPGTARLARDLGAGQVLDQGGAGGFDPDLVVVAAPPDVVAGLVARALAEYPAAAVTDIASVKGGILADLRRGVDPAALRRYVGSHPMAGSERSGPLAARADLFAGRPWVICTDHAAPDPGADATGEAEAGRAAALVLELATLAGAMTVRLDADEHDAAVARISHVPQVLSSLMAARLRDAPMDSVALAGQGLRDVTRIAASDPKLWAQILSANAAEVRGVLEEVRADLDEVIAALSLSGPDPVGMMGVLASAIGAGNEGQARIPGKHGAPATTYASVTVLVGDRPGELGRLFTEMGEAGINIEDLQLEHAGGQQFGLAEVSVLPAARGPLVEALRSRGWNVPE